jgi:branched-chain amino acid transport system substrate-binding protein
MSSVRRPFAALAVIGAVALALAGCGSSSSSSTGSGGGATTGSAATTTGAATSAATTGTGTGSSTGTGTGSSSGSPLGTPKKATGSPYVFGLINDETGAVTFPEARQGAIAAADYVNNYLGGINGHPIQIDDCIGDASPATSARCASELVGKHPLAILGAADVGSPASIPVYQRANLAYLGGIPFTPVEQNAPNSIQFWSLSLGDNAAAAVYAAKTLHIKSVAVLYFDNPQGKVSGLQILPPVFKSLGVSVKTIPIPPTTPDPSPEVASAVGDHTDAIYVDVPNGCGAVLKDIKSLGYSGKLLGIDPCSAPPVIASAAGGAQGLQYAGPFILPFGGSAQGNLFLAAMAKYAAKNTPIDSIALAGFATVINVQQVLSGITGTLNTKSILAAFKSGSNHPNFLSHPYTCNGQAVAKAVSICNDYYLISTIEGSKPVQKSTTDWVTSKGYFKGL